MLKAITNKEAKIFAEIISTNKIDRPILLSFPDVDVQICVETIEDIYYEGDKDGGIFLDKDGKAALKSRGNYYETGYYFREWYSKHLAHFNFFSKKHHRHYLTEFEFGQCLKDSKHIYILKRTDKLAGPGSMVRLFSGASSRAEKFERIQTLVSKLGVKILTHGDSEYMVVHKVTIEDMYDDSKHPKITRRLLSDWIKFSFFIEGIRSST